MLQSAFKLACIKYKSSHVIFRGQNFSRQSLIELRASLLSEEWQSMLQRKPFLVSDMLEAKVPFNEDMVEMFYKHLEFKIETHQNKLQQKQQISDYAL